MIDSHCHLDYEPLFENIDDILKRSREAGVENYLQFVLHYKVLIRLSI